MQINPEGIKLDREPSELDKFAINFSKAIGRRTRYVIVSGYVSILLGRARVSEDIDMLIPVMQEAEWVKIYSALEKEGYYCLNAGARESYTLLRDGLAARFAPKGIVIPNMEIMFAAKKIQKLALATAITVTIKKDKVKVSNLELQIAYKEIALGSPKDLEDARHLRKVLRKTINMQKLKEYERMLNETQFENG